MRQASVLMSHEMDVPNVGASVDILAMLPRQSESMYYFQEWVRYIRPSLGIGESGQREAPEVYMAVESTGMLPVKPLMAIMLRRKFHLSLALDNGTEPYLQAKTPNVISLEKLEVDQQLSLLAQMNLARLMLRTIFDDGRRASLGEKAWNVRPLSGLVVAFDGLSGVPRDRLLKNVNPGFAAVNHQVLEMLGLPVKVCVSDKSDDNIKTRYRNTLHTPRREVQEMRLL